MLLREALTLPALRRAQVVAGAASLSCEVRSVHMVDHPDLLPWVRPHQLLLTTGYAWPRDAAAQRALVTALAAAGLAAIGLAVPHFFDHFPPPVCDAAEAAGLPLLEIPWEIPFAQITEELHRVILAEQAATIERSEDIHRTLTQAATEGRSLQDLAETLSGLLQRAVSIVDDEGRLLAWRSLAQAGDPISATAVPPDDFDAHQLRLLHTSTSPIRLSASATPDCPAWVATPIRLQHELVGAVAVAEGNRRLDDLALRAIEHAAVVAALQISHQRELAALEARIGQTFLDTLIEGRFAATPQTLERAQLHGFVPDATYQVGLLVLDVAVPLAREAVVERDQLMEQLRRRLKRLGAPTLLAASLNQIAFLLPLPITGEQLWAQIADPTVALLLSRPYQGDDAIQRAYEEARALLPFVRFGAVQPYAALLLPRVLRGDPTAHEALLEELFGPLQRQKNGAILVETLVTWARHDFHLQRTADALHIHLKSLRYRLDRAFTLAHLDLAAPDTRFRVQLAAHLLSFKDNHSAG